MNECSDRSNGGDRLDLAMTAATIYNRAENLGLFGNKGENKYNPFLYSNCIETLLS